MPMFWTRSYKNYDGKVLRSHNGEPLFTLVIESRHPGTLPLAAGQYHSIRTQFM